MNYKRFPALTKVLPEATDGVIIGVSVGLTEDRRLFYDLRATCRIRVSSHAFKDYPERGFTKHEIVQLVRLGRGLVKDNVSNEAIDGSFIFETADEDGDFCRLVILPVKNNTELKVCSAYREKQIRS